MKRIELIKALQNEDDVIAFAFKFYFINKKPKCPRCKNSTIYYPIQKLYRCTKSRYQNKNTVNY